MKITFLNEAGVFGSYKKATAQSNIDNVKKELARDAAIHILEKSCDELAELYLDMLKDVNLETITISNKYKYNTESGRGEESNLIELSNYVANRYFTMSRKKEMQLNIIKNVYCNRAAIEYMISQGCFILPLVDTKRRWSIFGDSREIVPYKNMAKAAATAAEKVIKKHLSNFPNYAVTIPSNVKIVIIRDIFNSDYTAAYRSTHEQQFFSYMGITNKGAEFEYPGHGSSCLSHILDNYAFLATYCSLQPTKSDESIWKAIADPSPWMFNKIVFTSVDTNISTASANNFYAIKLLKSAVDNGVLLKSGSYINILVNDVLKNIQLINKVKQEFADNGLDNMVRYQFNDRSTFVDSLTNIGKEITSKQAEQEGILTDSLKRKVYEFDYNNAAEVKSAAKGLIAGCFKFLTDANIKKLAEDKMEEYLPVLMSKVLATKPNCISSSNKILLCDYHQNGATGKSNIRVVIDPGKVEINKKGNLVFYIAVDFKLPVRGVNPKYNNRATRQNNGKNYEYITGKKIKIELPL
jgi:hypothetical protein